MVPRPAGPWYTEERAQRWGWCLIAASVLVVYWPLSTFMYSTDGGDMFNCWLPWRHFITLALKNGELPLWNPLQQMGYPIYADLQGPAWYPEAIAIGGTVGHTIWTLQALFLMYTVLGGIGFMRLCRVLHGDARVALVTGLAYALSGFFVSRQMFMYTIISAAWMPWFLAAQVKLMRAPHWRHALEAAVCMMLLLTGGNHTFTIIAAYLLLPLSIVHAVRAWRTGGRRGVTVLLAHQMLFAGATALLACGTFYAFHEVSPYLWRTHGLPYSLSAQDPANKGTLSTALFPALFGKAPWSDDTPAAATNGYAGALVLALAAIALLRKRTATENTFALFGLWCLLTAFAQDLPFHRFAWRWLPGLNVFRFPNYYLYFTLVAVLLLAAGTMKEGVVWRWGGRRSPLMGIGAVLITGTAMVLLAPDRVPAGPDQLFGRSIFERVRALGYRERMQWGWAVTAPVLIVAFVLSWRRRLTPAALLALVTLDMGWNTQLCVWNSAVSDLHPAAIDARLAQVPRGPVMPDGLPLGLHHDPGTVLHPLWLNTQTFLGQSTREGFNSFWPSHMYSLLDDHPDLAKAMDSQPLVYLVDTVLPEHSLQNMVPGRGMAFVKEPPPTGLRRSPGDSLWYTSFRYSGIDLRTRTAAPTFLVVQQSWFPGWTIRIDHTPVDVERVNVAAFGTLLPAGEHVVDIRFEKPLVPWLMGFSMTAFILALLLLAARLHGHTRTAAFTGTALLAGMIGWSLLAHRPGYDDAQRRRTLHDHLAPTPSDVTEFELTGTPMAVARPEREWTPAFRIPTDSLLAGGCRTLLVDVGYRPHGRCQGLLVFQRTYQGQSTDYEAVPFIAPDSTSTRPGSFTVAHDLRELRYTSEELGIYVWNQETDTLFVTDMRVRVRPRPVQEE